MWSFWGLIHPIDSEYAGRRLDIQKKEGETGGENFVSLQKLREWEENLSGVRRFWGLVFLRLFTSSLFDYISYAAGLTAMKIQAFFFASLIKEDTKGGRGIEN